MEPVIEPIVTAEANLSDGDKQALAKARGEAPDYVAENFNTDGTPKGSDFVMPEKFAGKTAEEIAKAYTELESLKSKEANTAPLEGGEAPEAIKENNESPEASKEATEAPSTSVSPEYFLKFEQVYATEGALTEAHYTELSTKGFTKPMVDAYIEGQKAKGQVYANKVYEYSGGAEAYSELVQWGKDNLVGVAITDFDDKIKSGNPELAKLAIENLQAQRGTPPRRVDGGSGQDVGGVKPFKDKGEWQSYVRNPLYNKDKKYNEMVNSRYIVSKRKHTL